MSSQLTSPKLRMTALPKAGGASRMTGVVTLEQVAARAGVSPSTVSRILNGTAVVSQAKQEAVQDAIQALGFRPNLVARGLAGGRTMSVGVVTQIISSPFYGEALHGIEVTLEREGYMAIFVSGHWHEEGERKALETLMSRRVDGVIVLACKLPDNALMQHAGSLPFVTVGRKLSGPQMFSFSFDDYRGAMLATQHLIELGHRQIAFITGQLLHEDANERLRGYRDALTMAGLKLDPALVVQGDYTEAGGLAAAGRLLEQGVSFSALFASNDQMAIGAALCFHRKNLRVPEDVSIVGFDDLIMARYALPPLTTVRQSVYGIGCQAAQAMLAMLRGGAPTVDLPAPELVVRESTRRFQA